MPKREAISDSRKEGNSNNNLALHANYNANETYGKLFHLTNLKRKIDP